MWAKRLDRPVAGVTTWYARSRVHGNAAGFAGPNCTAMTRYRGCMKRGLWMDEQLWYDAFTYWRRLVSVARGLGLSHHDAEDLASEAIVATVTYPLLDKGRVNQLLFTAIRRDWVDIMRHRRRYVEIYPLLLEACTMDSPETQVSQQDEIRWTAHSAGLTRAEWAVVRLTADGHKHTEIARQLHITTHASEVALSRARLKVRNLTYSKQAEALATRAPKPAHPVS